MLNTPAHEAVHGIPVVCNEMVEGEAPMKQRPMSNLKKALQPASSACLCCGMGAVATRNGRHYLSISGVQSSHFTIMVKQGHSLHCLNSLWLTHPLVYPLPPLLSSWRA